MTNEKKNNDLQKKNYVHYLRLIILTNMKKSYESDISPNKYRDKLLLITNDRFTPF